MSTLDGDKSLSGVMAEKLNEVLTKADGTESILDLLTEVSNKVYEITGNRQMPEIKSTLKRKLKLNVNN